LNTESTFGMVQTHVVLFHLLQNLLQVFYVTTLFFCLNYQVVYVDLKVSPNLFCEGGVHASLKGGTCILEAERHNLIVIVLGIRHEGSFWRIQWIHLDLVVA
jgi:hypothetical protein